MQLTPNFTLSEFLRSDRAIELGIKNEPTPAHLENLKRLAEVAQQVRALLGNVPMVISSGYRSKELNAATPGSSSTSDHSNGLAFDFRADRYGNPINIARRIAASDLDFDQLIYEQKNGAEWVHLGIGSRMRRQVMSYSPKTSYVPGIQKLA